MNKIIACMIAVSLAGGGLTASVPLLAAKDKKPQAEIRLIGEPQSCVHIRQIRSTNVIDDSTIDFKMIGGKIFRNTLPLSCPRLGFEESFTYRLSTSQLCNVDIIRVLEQRGSGIEETVACGLGKFQQIEKIKTVG